MPPRPKTTDALAKHTNQTPVLFGDALDKWKSALIAIGCEFGKTSPRDSSELFPGEDSEVNQGYYFRDGESADYLHNGMQSTIW